MDIKHKNKTINILLAKYPYDHGFSYEALVIENNTSIGKIKFLYDKADPKYEEVSKLTGSELLEQLSNALINGKLESTIEMVYDMKKQTKLKLPSLITPCSKWF
jgi:hypothetical protein